MYVSSIGSLTPAGEVVVTIDDLSRHGFRWEQLLIALPFMAVFRRGVKSLKIKLPGGKQLNLSGETLEFLVKLDSRERQQLLAKAKKAKTPQASLAIIERGVQGRRRKSLTGKKPKSRPKVRPKPGPGKWIQVNEAMSDRARAYQQQITGRTEQSYLVRGVKFDGFKDGVLLEAKGPGHVNFVKRPDSLHRWFEGADDLTKQARDQLHAAASSQLEWHVAEEHFIVALKNLFRRNKVTGIKIIHTPASK